MEPDSSLDLIEDLPGIGRRYEMTGTNSGRRVVHGLDPGADQASKDGVIGAGIHARAVRRPRQSG